MPLLLLFVLAQEPLYFDPLDPAADERQLRQEIAADAFYEPYWLERVGLYTRLEAIECTAGFAPLLAEQAPDQPVFLELQMMVEFSVGSTERAISLAEGLATRFPYHESIYGNLAQLYAFSGRHVDALNLYVQILSHRDLSKTQWLLLFETLAKSTIPPEELIKQLVKKAEEHPESLGIVRLIVACLVRVGQYDLAVQWIERKPELLENDDMQHFVQRIRGFR